MLNARRETILNLVAETYIGTAHPVPSSRIARRLGLSSATVRNEFGALEEGGWLQQPHTSAGRIPTPRGFRRYARGCIPPRALPLRERSALRARFDHAHGEALVRAVARSSAELSGYAVVVTLPTDTVLRIREIHLSLLSSRRLLAVVVLENGLVRQLGVDLDPAPEDDVLDDAERSLRRLTQPLGELAGTLRALAERSDGELARTLAALADAWPALHPPPGIVHDGLSNLLSEPESRDPEFVRLALEQLERSGEGGVPPAPPPAEDGFRLRLDDALARVSTQLPLGSAGVTGWLTLVGPARMRYPAALMVARGVAEVVAAQVAEGGAA